MNNPIDQHRAEELIAGYFSEELSNRELSALRHWLSVSDENMAYFRQLQEVWFSAIGADDNSRFDKEQAFRRFLARKALASEGVENRRSRFRFSFPRIAAAVALLVLFCSIGYWQGTHRQVEYLSAEMTVEAPLGSRTKLHLPDGTLIWLNAGSSASYAQNFGEADRSISIEGEAYFEVVKDEKKPFYVKTKELSVQVLGTKFNFRNYADEEEARVTLLEGKVNVVSGLSEKKEFLLTPDQQVIFDKRSNQTMVASVKSQRASAWTDGVIFFDEERLPDIARELERLYNVKISLADKSLENIRFYGSFIRTEQPIQEVLEILGSTNRVDYKINEREIIFFAK